MRGGVGDGVSPRAVGLFVRRIPSVLTWHKQRKLARVLVA